MEEKILEIIKDHEHDFQYYFESPQRDIAEAITTHVMEFIEWKDEECTRLYNPCDHNQRLWIINDSDGETKYGVNGLFKYWWNNIKNK